MAPTDWTRLTEARGLRRLAVVCGHIFRRPHLLVAVGGTAFLVSRFGKDVPLLYGVLPVLGAVLLSISMGRFRPADSDDPGPQA
ncbi:hypothetical protein OHS17_19010 [Streptomyces sp. NBC_00523]|uniref:hypothetical protein n=1 Tax=Streptomyces sp. NBC_00523 TaxID=2975765 RepID=UPI002E80D003|nr:hypothetical protein [Streptomyces sp. NBC_00523]WUD01597.1 hypothetical protein OHS17_19010 [Streptomyces sp. NBC_00523]